MSRQIDTSKPLSAKDRKYLEERGRLNEVAYSDQLAAGGVTVDAWGNPVDGGSYDEAVNTGDTGSEVDDGGASDDGSDESEDDVADEYTDMSVDELRDECAARGLTKGGNKPELQARLREHDKNGD